MATASLANLPFFIAGGLKVAYDLLLYRAFKSTKTPEEAAAVARRTGSGERRVESSRSGPTN
jgi:hypothetical protein